MKRKIVLSPEEAFCMWVFLNMMFYREGLLEPRQPPSWRTTPCRLSTTAYSIYSQLPSVSETVPLSPTWGPAMPWWQGPTTYLHCIKKYISRICKACLETWSQYLRLLHKIEEYELQGKNTSKIHNRSRLFYVITFHDSCMKKQRTLYFARNTTTGYSPSRCWGQEIYLQLDAVQPLAL